MKNQIKGTLFPNEISTFCTQIAMILKAGIPISEGISIMYEDMKNTDGKKILTMIKNHIEDGEPLHMALLATNNFPDYVIDMTRIGEQSGRLDEVMDSLCSYYEREESIVKSVKSAVVYPLVMIAMMLIVIGVLVVKVLPIFSQVYEQLGSTLSPLAQGVIQIGTAIIGYAVIVITLIILLLIVLYFIRKTSKGRALLTHFKSTFFMSKKISAKIASGRFASAMALMMSSGLDVDHSLELAQKLIDNNLINDKITKCKELVLNGASFSTSLSQTGIFSGVYARMVAVGFKTGSADTVMKKLAERYEEEVDGQINRIISVLEPTLVAVLSVVVGMILLSVMLPLMGIMSSIG